MIEEEGCEQNLWKVGISGVREKQSLEGWVSQLRGRGADMYTVPTKG